MSEESVRDQIEVIIFGEIKAVPLKEANISYLKQKAYIIEDKWYKQ